MNFKNIISKINGNIYVRNIILAVCGIFVLVFISSLALKGFTRHNNSETVPDFSGLSMQEARKAAKSGSLKIEVNDSLYVPTYEGGIVLDQLPKAGARVKSGRRIFVTVNAYHQKMVRIPYVTGYSLRQAKNNLEVAGFEIDKLIFRQDIATNNVLEQLYNGKVIDRNSTLEAEEGSGITLVVGMGEGQGTASVPKLVGFPLHQAKSRLWEAGLNVGKIEFDQDVSILNRSEAKVYAQSPEQGVRTPAGTPVTIRLSVDNEKVTKGSSTSDKEAKRIISNQNSQEARAAEEARQQQEE